MLGDLAENADADVADYFSEHPPTFSSVETQFYEVLSKLSTVDCKPL